MMVGSFLSLRRISDAVNYEYENTEVDDVRVVEVTSVQCIEIIVTTIEKATKMIEKMNFKSQYEMEL